MKTLRCTFIALFFLTLFVSPARGAAGPSILAFQINGIGVFPAAGDTIYSGQLAWIPSLSAGAIGVRGELGAAWLKNVANDRFWQLNYEGYLVFSVTPVTDIELGGGLATWTGGNGGTHPILGGYLVFSLPGLFHRIYAGYSRFLVSGANANELKVGFGFSL